MLHAPDFPGYPGVVEMAADWEIAARGLALRRAGSAIMEQLGGRAIHPVNVRVGGFYRVPPPASLPRWPRCCAVRLRTRWTPCSGCRTSTSPTSTVILSCSRRGSPADFGTGPGLSPPVAAAAAALAAGVLANVTAGH